MNVTKEIHGRGVTLGDIRCAPNKGHIGDCSWARK